MVKVKKKKNRKLRRQIRKTVGALLMVSAITVAAIPVRDVRADDEEGIVTYDGDIVTYADTDGKIQVLNYTSSAMSDYDLLKNTTGANLGTISDFLKSGVPYVDKDATIYTTGDGMFQFAYIKPSATATNEVAVILGANVEGLPGGNLRIPATVDAYKKYTANQTNTGYCAVNRRGEFLYYMSSTQKIDPDTREKVYWLPTTPTLPPGETVADPLTKFDSHMVEAGENEDGTKKYVYRVQMGQDGSGNPIIQDYPVLPKMEDAMVPCYYNDRSNWIEKPDTELYYWNDTGDVDATDITKFEACIGTEYQRIYNADVQYIGRQNLVPNTGTSGSTQTGAGQSEWKVGEVVTETNPGKGVFAGKGQIVNLTIETIETDDGPKGNLLGIGDYAFYGCSGLKAIKLENGLNTIGNGVFEQCVNMETCDLALFSQLSVIGKRAFSNCKKLSKIVIPVNVRAIGDFCFEGCASTNQNTGLETIELCGEGNNVLLSAIGYKAFAGCSKLISITFPDNYEDFETGTETDAEGKTYDVTGIPITYFDGCTSLQYIKVQNGVFTFVETNHNDALECDIGKFLKETVSEAFYFEGPELSAIHTTAKRHSAAYKYIIKDENGNDQNRYEKVIWCPETKYNDDGSIIPDTGHECTFVVDDYNSLVNMEIPEECGVVEIPANIGGGHGIERLGSTSFQNNCFLQKITIPSTVKYIDDNAFKGCHKLKHVVFSQPINIETIGTGAFSTQVVDLHKTNCTDRDLDDEPFLSFTGVISPDSIPFQYAMDSQNNIADRTQPNTYITFYSGWPTNLTVRYNPDTDKNELLDYPKYDDLSKYVAWTKDGPGADEITYPDMTEEYATAANGAVGAGSPTGSQQEILDAVHYINLPAGIESIKKEIFSKFEKDQDGNPVIENGNIKYTFQNTEVMSITTNTVEKIDPYTFSGCNKLSGFFMADGKEIGNYAFKDCEVLENVSISPNVTTLGVRPFAGCEILTDVNFGESPNFVSDQSIIYGLSDGTKNSIVECLEIRGRGAGAYTVGPDELAGVTSIQEEAFMDCAGIGTVDLTATSVGEIPERTFKNTKDLTTVNLPSTVGNIYSEAFCDGGLRLLRIPGYQATIAEDAFQQGDWRQTDEDRKNKPAGNIANEQKIITFECTQGALADKYTNNYWYINPEYGKVFLTRDVTFYDYPDYPDTSNRVKFWEVKNVREDEAAPEPPNPPESHNGYVFLGWMNNNPGEVNVLPQFGTGVHQVTFVDGCPKDSVGIIEIQPVEEGRNPKYPTPPEHEGYVFEGWVPELDDNGVMDDMTIVASYSSSSASENIHTVTFYDLEGNVYTTQKVGHGESISPITGPTRTGYTFIKWVANGDLTKVESDLIATPMYEPVGNTNTSPGTNPSANPSGGGNNGGSGATPTPDKKSKSSATPTPTATPTPEVRKYTVSVSGGSGSGSYAAGQIVSINAYFMGEGQVFDKWTSSTAGVGFANPNASSTTFTMPAANVAVTATYKTGGSGSATTNASGGGNGGGGTTGTVNQNNGTTVDVTKPGFSNTNLAGATVSGATDNFVVKVTEDQIATDAATSALQARYGSLDRIKYLPMDISLYDSTGRTKIADTSGISVNLTLPLPDDLVQYAGNNRVAAISGGQLEDLNTRFTTVGGVPCVNFTATHFSPYVIYVDTANLTEATIDATPKTGDPIHPKWFLSLGMACLALILFFKKDRAVVVKKKRVA